MATVRLLALDPTYGIPTETASTDVGQLGQLSLLGINGVAINAGGNLISQVANPVAATDAANKGYVDGIAVGISAIPSVSVLANANVALSGLQTIDGYTLTAGDRVLLTGQTNGVQNGVWVAASSSWSRPTPSDDYVSGRSAAGVFTFVETGTVWAATGFIQLVKTAKVDTDATTWTQFTGLGEVTAGSGLIKSTTSGNTVAITLATNSGLQFTSGALDHLLSSTGGINKSASGLGVTLNSNATLAVDANGLRTLGLPTLFTVGGTAVDANVTAANLSALNDGNTSLVDSLHSHASVLSAQARSAVHKNGSVAVAAGEPVQWSSTADTLQRADAVTSTKAQVIGVAAGAIAANGTGTVVKAGVVTGVLTQATPGTPYYLAVGGGLTSSITQAFSGTIFRIGWAKNATDLEVSPQWMGQRGAN